VAVSVVVLDLEVLDDHAGLEHSVPVVAVEALRLGASYPSATSCEHPMSDTQLAEAALPVRPARR
jgi:hypothetical protein